jgi:hypothetical protein
VPEILPQINLKMLTNSDVEEYTIRRDETGAIKCRLYANDGSPRTLSSLITGPRSSLFWHKPGLLKKFNEKFKNESRLGIAHIISPAHSSSQENNTEFKRFNPHHPYITIAIDSTATIADVKRWFLDAGFEIGRIIADFSLLLNDQNMSMNSLVEQHEQQRRNVEQKEKKIPEFSDYIANLPVSEKQQLKDGFNEKVKKIKYNLKQDIREECCITCNEILLEPGNTNKYIMILTCDEQNGANPYSASFFVPDVETDKHTSEKIIKYLSKLHESPIFNADGDPMMEHIDPNNRMKVVAIAQGTFDELNTMVQNIVPATTPQADNEDEHDIKSARRKSSSSKPKFS